MSAVLDLIKGQTLYYINKFTTILETATVSEVYDGGFSVFFYIGSRLCYVRLHDDAFNTRLFPTRQSASDSWSKKHSDTAVYTDDLTIKCKRCGKPFVWSASDREYYRQHSLYAPTYCPDCRKDNRKLANRSRRHNFESSDYELNNIIYDDFAKEQAAFNRDFISDVEDYSRSNDGWFYPD